MISINPRDVLVCILTAGRTARRVTRKRGRILGRILGPLKAETPLWGKRGFHWEARIGGSTRFMDKTRERAKRFKPTLKNGNTAKTATPLSGVYSPGGAAVELDGNVPVQIGLRPCEKVQRAGGDFSRARNRHPAAQGRRRFRR